MVGLDLEAKPDPQAWRLAILEPGREPRHLSGRLTIRRRDFPVQRLTLPTAMVDLDPETERRAVSEGERLRTLYRTITAERLWRGRFVRPVAGIEAPTGFGARRIINGQPRAPHSGADYAAERGTPVVAANGGRVALVADFFFPGRLVAVDHGLGLYTLYFHLDSVAVTDGELGRPRPASRHGGGERARDGPAPALRRPARRIAHRSGRPALARSTRVAVARCECASAHPPTPARDSTTP